jgi:hypothetical protein
MEDHSQGAATSVWVGFVAPADEIGGRYCENCHVGQIVPDHVTISAISEGVRGYAPDPKKCRGALEGKRGTGRRVLLAIQFPSRSLRTSVGISSGILVCI